MNCLCTVTLRTIRTVSGGSAVERVGGVRRVAVVTQGDPVTRGVRPREALQRALVGGVGGSRHQGGGPGRQQPRARSDYNTK